MPLWVWRWTTYRPVLCRGIRLRSVRRRVRIAGEVLVVNEVVVSFEDWRGGEHDVIREGVLDVGGVIDHDITSIGLRLFARGAESSPEGTKP